MSSATRTLSLADIAFAPAGRRLLDGVNLDLAGEGISVVLGHNGAGKTLLLKLIAGLLQGWQGRLHWQPQPPQRLAMLFQEPMLLRLSVLANVRCVLGPQGLTGRQAAARSADMLERVGLFHRRHDPARQLSGGERQRLALARAWAIAPQWLLLDEPTASLDPAATAEVERIIREIRSTGCKILISTHNLAQATRLADDIVFLDQGRVLETALTQRFFSRPQTAAARAFIKGELPWRIAFDA